MAANAQGIRARADVFDEQILRYIFSFVLGSSELALKYSLQPETGHYLVKAGWPVVLKKMGHWKEADTPSVFAAVPTKNPAIQTSQTIAGHLSKSLLAGQRS